MAESEHALQIAVKKWCRECIAERYVLLAFDRSKAPGQFTHAREKARGIRAGTPDLQILFRGRSVWIELKAASGTVSEAQTALHAEMGEVGHAVHVCRSVVEVMGVLVAAGLKTTPTAALHAEAKDRFLATPKEPKKRAPAKPRAKRPTPRQLATARSWWGI